MIKIFIYKNKAGRVSTKAIAVTGENSSMLGGISLGKVMLNSSLSIDEVLSAYAGYKPLDHLPRKGEGLPQFNEAYKLFSKSSIVAPIGLLTVTNDTVPAIKQIVSAIKTLDTSETDDKIAVRESMSDSFSTVYDNCFKHWLDAELSISDYEEAFEDGWLGRPLKDREDGNFETEKDYDYYCDAYEEGKRNSENAMSTTFEEKYNDTFSKWLDAELSIDDYMEAFEDGWLDRPLKDRADGDFETEKDYDYYCSAYNIGAELSRAE